jgi:type IX secretion system PorP/SprF family membrane protein
MKRKLIAGFIGLLFSSAAIAQQDAAFSQYFFNMLYVNPAYAGTRDFLSGTLIHRTQWMGVNGAPSTQTLNVHSALNGGKVGLGLQLINDQAGPIKTTGFAVSYAYHLPVNDETQLSLGLSGSVASLRISGDQIRIEDQSDLSFSTGSSSAIVPDAAAGLYLHQQRWYVGFSVSHLLQTKFSINDAAGKNSAKYYRNYFLAAGRVFKINDEVDFRPSFLAKYVQSAPIIGELDACFIFRQRFFAGGGLRASKRINIDGMDNVLVAIAEVEFLRSFRFGYSFDYYIGKKAVYNGGTHEIMLGWDLSKARTKMQNPRFF